MNVVISMEYVLGDLMELYKGVMIQIDVVAKECLVRDWFVFCCEKNNYRNDRWLRAP